jgi:hypothetical protein
MPSISIFGPLYNKPLEGFSYAGVFGAWGGFFFFFFFFL